ncbi:thioredoxin fold domain-containing protein [Hansschlegelia sp. KR7-227]|uniref:thioredoxin fold domain-containing protein n=1 Tax=Hansschlegelia sp. KR7-227 TaxID=3400914 RepID=UPI003C06639D
MEFIFECDYISNMPFRRILVLAAFVIGSQIASVAVRAAELVMFEQPGCVWCQRFEAEVAPGYGNADEGRLAPLRRIDIRAQDKAGFALANNVRITPTFVLVNDGREIGRLTGYPGRDFFWTELAELTVRLPKSSNPD